MNCKDNVIEMQIYYLLLDIGLDIQDDLGRHEVGFVENTVKLPINDEGCLFEANFLINKVPGESILFFS